MRRRDLWNAFVALLLAQASLFGAWMPPSNPGVRIIPDVSGTWRIDSSNEGEFTLESSENYKAGPGDAFELDVRIRVEVKTKALPELVCYDRAGREIPIASSLVTGPTGYTTDWLHYQRVFPTRPGTASVRARIRAAGQGHVWVADLKFRPAKVDAFRTGALITQIYPNRRRGLTLAANHGVVNTELVMERDQDGDGKWSLVLVDLDRISEPERKGVDWRTGFEYRPNESYWFDGAVLKSDSALDDRAPDASKALHFRMRAHQGPYRAILNDPGRAVAISRDRRSWKRYEGGSEADLGTFDASDGTIEFWVDACYRDPVSAGPAYVNYVRLNPVDGAPSVNKLFAAARQHVRPLARGSVDEKRVDVRLVAPRFAQGRNWPVGCGIPIPAGELASPDHAAVINTRGTKIASQNRAMATWPDGSVKWLYLDFFHDFSEAGDGRYTITYGNRVKPAPAGQGVRVSHTAAGLAVDTGAIRFVVPRNRFGIVEEVRLASGKLVQKEPISPEIVESNGKVWRALELPVAKLELEQAGPLHTVILAETRRPASGRPASGFAHRARIHAYAGSPLVEIEYFTANTDSRPAGGADRAGLSRVEVKSIALKVHPADPITTALHGSGRGAASGALVQASAEGDVAGWIGVQSRAGATLYAGVQAFREQFPKALRWKPNELEISLWAEEGGAYEWIEGVGKTHHVSLLYGSAGLSDGALLAEGRVPALADPEWYSASGAFGRLTLARNSGLPAVEKKLADHMQGPVIAKVGLGFENYGDHSAAGYVKGSPLWANNEYDVPAGAVMHFARTGDRNALRFGLASALHYLDVDTVHYSALHSDWARAQRVHSHGTFGHHTAQGPDMHHAGFVLGLMWYSYFTGERAGLEGARGIADWVLRNLRPEDSVGGMERALGHPLMTLNDVYEATWDDNYLKGAARLVDWAMKWEHPARSGFLAPITESPAYYSGSPFCGGLLPTALIQFNRWAKLPEIDEMLERVARWTLTDVWRPPANIQQKGGSPRRHMGAQNIASHLPLMSYVFARTGDPLFLAVPREAVVQGFREEAQQIGARSAGIVFKYVPSFLATLAEQGYPQPEPDVVVRAKANPVAAVRGAKTRVCFTLGNGGASAARRLKASFQPRVDLLVTQAPPVPDALDAGRDVELCYDVKIPDQLNLTSEANRLAYAHLSVLYERDNKPHVTHTWIQFRVEEK